MSDLKNTLAAWLGSGRATLWYFAATFFFVELGWPQVALLLLGGGLVTVAVQGERRHAELRTEIAALRGGMPAAPKPERNATPGQG